MSTKQTPPETPVGVGLIGCGNFARWQHLPNLARLPQADFRWTCDRDSALAEDCARRFGAAHASDDAAQVLDDDQVKAVVIAVRDHLQADLAIQALAAGKHVYVEKPVGTTPDQVAAVAAAAESADRMVVVGFQKRHAPAYQAARASLHEAGGVRQLSLRMADDAWRWAHGYQPGELLRHDVCHLFDLIRWLTNDAIASVYAVSCRPDDDNLILTTTGGVVASIVASGHGSMDMPKERLEAIADRGGLTVEDFAELTRYGAVEGQRRQTFAGSSHPEHEFLPRYLIEELGAEGLAAIRRVSWRLNHQRPDQPQPDSAEVERFIGQAIPNFMRDQGWMQAMQRFLLAAAGGHRHPDLATIDDAVASAAITQAALASRDTGRVVDLSQATAKLATPGE